MHQALTGILTEQKLISDCRYRVIESSSLVPVLFGEVFSHPYISFFHLLVNGFSVIYVSLQDSVDYLTGIGSVIENRAVASGPAGPTLVGPLFGSKMRECLDDSYARAHALTVATVFHSVDRGMHSSFTEIMTQKFADIPERPLSL